MSRSSCGSRVAILDADRLYMCVHERQKGKVSTRGAAGSGCLHVCIEGGLLSWPLNADKNKLHHSKFPSAGALSINKPYFSVARHNIQHSLRSKEPLVLSKSQELSFISFGHIIVYIVLIISLIPYNIVLLKMKAEGWRYLKTGQIKLKIYN